MALEALPGYDREMAHHKRHHEVLVAPARRR
jgi:hypothetical protein